MSGEISSISTCRRPLRVGTRRDVGCSHTLRHSIELPEVPPRLNQHDRRAKRRSFVSGVLIRGESRALKRWPMLRFALRTPEMTFPSNKKAIHPRAMGNIQISFAFIARY